RAARHSEYRNAAACSCRRSRAPCSDSFGIPRDWRRDLEGCLPRPWSRARTVRVASRPPPQMRCTRAAPLPRQSRLDENCSLRSLIRLLRLRPARCLIVPSAECRDELVDQVLQHERILDVHDLIAVRQVLLGPADLETDILPAEQTRRHDARVTILGDLVV